MTTEKFSREQFENALPIDENGNQLWLGLGINKGEYTYIMPIKNGNVKRVAIMIRSSVNQSGYAADSGDDSIRLWLVNSETYKPLGQKVDAYTTRVNGWQNRMNEKVKALYEQGLKMQNCPKCQIGVMVERSGKYGKFYGCSNYPQCKHTANSLNVTVEKTHIENKIEIDLLESLLEKELQDSTQIQIESSNRQLAETRKANQFTPSKYQTAIFDFVQNGTGNAVVSAVAGSGKTTTIVKALEFTPNDVSVAFVAFNKAIAEELKKRAPGHVSVSTLHSLGYNNIRAVFPRVKVENKKVYWIIKDYLKSEDESQFANVISNNLNAVTRLVSLLKSTLLSPTFENLEQLSKTYNVDVNGNANDIYRMVTIAFEQSVKQTWRIDFDDMIYFCAIGIVPCEKFDWLFVDEAQDMNKAQIKMMLNSINSNSRVICVGDEKQSIYGFRAADTNAMSNIVTALDATILPLSVSYRCPKSHIALAQTIAPQIQAADNAIDGILENVNYQDFMSIVKVNDMVLCRTNAPLVKPVFQLIRNGTKAVIMGRDIGEDLVNLVEKIEKKSKAHSIETLLYSLQDYFASEYGKLLAQDKETQAQNLEDKVQTIIALADNCKDIVELKANINKVFSDNADGVVFSSIHKAKGMESDTVYILHPELMPHPMALKSDNQDAIRQEMNIKYVALTRSKNALYFVR